ncbi:hypothetical protein ABW19_dt0207501 [Dactylella cylindrospora]|nr:hypothetical protein ABW19_dt0207501 [Dactylella cylindrospora]
MMATFQPWAIKHREAVSKPIVDAFIAEVRKDTSISKLGVVGFCWGGRHAILQAREGTGINAAAALHPSLTAPADFEPVSVPLYLGLGDRDSVVPKSAVDAIIDVMEKKTDLDKEIRIFPNQIHGFAVRGDYSSDEDRKAMDQAAEEVVAWFQKYLS